MEIYIYTRIPKKARKNAVQALGQARKQEGSMTGRTRNKKIEYHISLLTETARELEALMDYEREAYASSVIDRAIHARYSRLPNDIKLQLKEKSR